MKILYGIQGTGNGHVSRARIMARHFARKKADVDYLFSGRERDKFFDMEEDFGNFAVRRGLTFATKNGRIHYLNTARNNSLLRMITDVRQLDISAYDLIITDFEPVSAWAGRIAGKRVIGIGHQYAFPYKIPLAGQSLVAEFIMRHFAPADINVGLHWSHFNQPIMPPIVDPKLQRAATDKPHVLVYLPFENQQRVTEWLHQLTNYRFCQYSSELSDTEAANVSLRKTSLHGFHRDLISADAVICNAGFELVSECIHLGIPVLVKPLKGQMEQLSNAAALVQLDLAQRCDVITLETMESWLAQPKTPARRPYPDVANALTDWVLEGKWNNLDGLAQQLWSDGEVTNNHNDSDALRNAVSY